MIKPNVIDIISVSPVTGHVELSILDDNDWASVNDQLDALIEKLDYYVSFAKSDERQAVPAYKGRDVTIVCHFNGRPKARVRQVMVAMAQRVSEEGIGFAATEADPQGQRVDLATWPTLLELEDASPKPGSEAFAERSRHLFN